ALSKEGNRSRQLRLHLLLERAMRNRVHAVDLDVAQFVSHARIDRIGQRYAWLSQVGHLGPVHRGEEVALPLRVVEQAAPAFLERELIHAALFVERQNLDLLIWT